MDLRGLRAGKGASVICLFADEIEAITGKVRHSAQRRALDVLGVPYRVRPDGSPLVLRADIERQPAEQTKRRPQPNFAAAR